MKQQIKTIIIFLGMCTMNSLSYADPWFTGPLLAPSGHTIPNGHTNFEMYGLDVHSNGQYNREGNLISTPLVRSVISNPVFTHGFTDWLDIQWTVPYTFNSTRGVHYNRLTDISAAAGIQLMEQKGSPYSMDVRILLQETFPTGRYEDLNPVLLGTDATGLGSYQTQIGVDLQYLREIYNAHYLRTRLIISHWHASPVSVNGLSSYGGTLTTHGRIDAADEDDVDFAAELTLTQKWVAVFEVTYSKGSATQFNGIAQLGTFLTPQAVNLGSGKYNETALAPAMEYNFNGNVGLIGGVWFPISGMNTPHYTTYVLALNVYW
jgi:hypothetical protein